MMVDRDCSAALGERTSLDAHFETCRAMYETAVRAAGFQRGWHVLDAGSGPGGYLPWLGELVGRSGQITALDLDAAHIQTIAQSSGHLPCKIDAKVGSLLEMPFETDRFDAVWLSNALVHCDDADLMIALAECQRVVRPGGIIAVKELLEESLAPLPPTIFANYWDACLAGLSAKHPWSVMVHRSRTALDLHVYLERSGLVNVRQQLFTYEYGAPLEPCQREWLMSLLGYCRAYVDEFRVPDADLPFWHSMTPEGFAAPGHFINHPRLRVREGNVLAVGTVPSRS
jgi:ubiquinone/menaquinone biosynthesis C-methylase UbiE